MKQRRYMMHGDEEVKWGRRDEGGWSHGARGTGGGTRGHRRWYTSAQDTQGWRVGHEGLGCAGLGCAWLGQGDVWGWGGRLNGPRKE